ncbi:hypothetical protein ACFFUT_10630 [Pseudohalocynthiibacter aestuariivivens]|jgi:uncharacterized protein YPO0396|uniref:Uncharacterized protein n=1 Tax=Pseudohalocynthiibacter aestuariivivens TaxID=1591409 RepID=A0ABV5JHJ8_9RHOB|nr:MULTISPECIES: hypothetical protein [Pseudohalocynthiibacter]MBS9716431.1 hypothetical protein [Pseudohalocynthiibacter aestuariivivens]MCK0100760.1 hypothetical protein [Pseudohalocynthiibacter sp. F2068]
MSDIADLERRITAALDRIGQSVEAIDQSEPGTTDDTEEVARLSEELEAEKTANAQLQERLRTVHEKLEAKIAELETSNSQLTEELAAQTTGLQQMKQANAQMRESNQKLRDANQEGVGDSHLINKAMMAELEALRATQSSDRAEMDAVLNELKPFVGEDA